MTGVLLFLHLAGLSVWLGSMFVIALLFLGIRKQVDSADVRRLTVGIVKTFNALTHPAAFLVLVSGIVLMVQTGLGDNRNTPFWLSYMQTAGGVIIIAFMVAVSLLGRRMLKRMTLSSHDSSAAQANPGSGIAAYAGALFVTIVLVLSVIYVASVKM